MTTVRVLVGTTQSLFILTSDAKRQKWDVSWPSSAAGRSHAEGLLAVDPNRFLRIADQRLVRAGHP